MTETKSQYTIDVSIDATLRHLVSLAHNYVAACAMRDAQRLEAGETVTYTPTGKTVRLMTDEQSTQTGDTMTVAELIAKLQEMPHDAPVVVRGYESGFDAASTVSLTSIVQAGQYGSYVDGAWQPADWHDAPDDAVAHDAVYIASGGYEP